MKQPIDRITEAYYDELGTSFGRKVRSRIHWICSQSSGESILDVGCSQGITSILLGREAKKVLGIDLLQESIEFAKQSLQEESEVTQQYVNFETANFIDYDFGNVSYDTIILGEVLEHITDPERFIHKAYGLLEEEGKLIITVPFGINDFFDHKKTYYLNDLLSLQMEGLQIEEVAFLGKWVGMVLRKSQSHKTTTGLNRDLLKQLEDAFFAIERNLVDEVAHKTKKIEELTTLLKEKEDENLNLLNGNNEHTHLLKEQEQENSSLLKANHELLDKVKSLEEELAKVKSENEKNVKMYENRLIEEKEKVVQVFKDKISVEEQLQESVNKELILLKEHKLLTKRYYALSNSKLGKITKYYWSLRNKKK